MNIKNIRIWFLVILVSLVVTSTAISQNTIIKSQPGVNLLMCNEKDTVKTTYYYPRDAVEIKTNKGIETVLEWRGIINNQKGKYNLLISSRSDFMFAKATREKVPNAKWKGAGNGLRANPVNISGTNYFQHRKLFTSSGFFDNPYEVLIRVGPKNSAQAEITFAWYTTDCEDAKPVPNVSTGCRWENAGHPPLGTGAACVCNGNVVSNSRCNMP